jgi:hypothetical protein
MGLGGGYVFIGLSHGVGVIKAAALLGCAAVLLGVRWFIRRYLPAPVVIGAAGVGLTAKPPASPAS